MNKTSVENIFPLSPMQEGMLFHTLYAPHSGMYCEQFTWPAEITSVPAFEQAWQQVINHHPVLRTAFFWEQAEKNMQVTFRDVTMPFTTLDWSHLPETEQEAALKQHLKADREAGFDLNRPPLMRAALIKREDDRYWFCWSYHHLLLDGWSSYLVLKDVFSAYQAQLDRQQPEFAVLPPYSHFVSWLSKQDLNQAETFWRDYLRGFNAPNVVGNSSQAVKQDNPVYHTLVNQLSTEETASLQAIAKKQRLTLNTLLQAAWALLVHHHSRDSDIVFGMSVSGRPAELKDVDKMVGLFINTLPVRTTILPEQKVTDWLKAVQKQQLKTQPYEYTPLQDIQSWSEVPQGTALFDSMLAVETYPIGSHAGRMAELEVHQSTNYPLTVVIEPGVQLALRISYDTSRFAEAEATRLLEQYRHILCHLPGAMDKPVGEVPWVPEHQLAEVMALTGNDERCFPVEQCLHQLFSEQARLSPEAVAVSDEAGSLTYGELDALSNRWANKLIADGIEPEDKVGICLPRSTDLIVAILAVLKAGACYVPLDGDAPSQRLKYIIEDARLKRVLIATEEQADIAPGICQVMSESSLSPVHSHAELAVDVNPQNAAYIIYTSGSTGNPKGVVVEHRQVVRLFSATDHWFGFTDNDVWTLFHSAAFDFSVWEIWGALIYGGELVVVPFWVSRSPDAFFALLADKQVTVLNQTPSAFRQLTAVAKSLPRQEAKQLALRYVVFGGEALDYQALAPWFEIYGDDQPTLINMYGITETTVHVTYREVREADLGQSAAASAIGQAIPDLRVMVLDDHLEPVPVGVPGELCVAGAGVTRGYLGRPELNQTRFISHPQLKDGERLYRSGDLVSCLEDGSLDYLGRIDQQVKIRGFRIELGEIESALGALPGVSEAVVTASQLNGQKLLVAYYVAEAGGALDHHALRQQLDNVLPSYMLPAAYVPLETVPLTINNKVDRKALPAPELGQQASGEYRPPVTATEKVLVELWGQLLSVTQIGIDDNFFELGGDSILSIQMVARAKKHSLRIAPKEVFEYPTIAGLAEHLDATVREVEVVDQGVVSGEMPLMPVACWWLALEPENPNHYNQAFVMRTPQDFCVESMTAALNAVIRHHDALRLRLVEGDGRYRADIMAKAESVSVEVARSGTTGEERREYIRQVGQRIQASLRPADGRNLRAAWIPPQHDHSGKLVLAIHHLVVDGVSWRILLDDLMSAYHQICQGENVALPDKTHAYSLWAEKLVAFAQSESITEQLPYWQAATRADLAPLPTDFEGEQANVYASQKIHTVTLDKTTTRQILGDANKAYKTSVNDILVAGLAKSLAVWSGNTAIRLDLEGHGREDIFPELDISRTVGWFTSIYPVCLEVSQTGGVELLKSVKEQLRRVPMQGLGFGLLNFLAGESQLSYLPQVAFNYLGRFSPTSADEGFSLADDEVGLTADENNRRSHHIIIDAWETDQQLTFRWSYSSAIHRDETVARLAEGYLAQLAEITAACCAPDTKGYTPSDFPLLDLSQCQVDRLVAEYPDMVDAYPLSATQKGMLFHSLYDNDDDAYVNQFCCEFGDNLEESVFQQAWEGVLARHPALRSCFLWQDRDEPTQIVVDRSAGYFAPQPQAVLKMDALDEWLAADREKGLDLNAVPMRMHLLPTDRESWLFVWTHHHILFDGWSLAQILGEVFHCYESLLNGAAPDLAPVKSYQEYIAWRSQEGDKDSEAFWRGQLEGMESATPIMVDTVPASTSGRKADGLNLYVQHCDRALSSALNALAKDKQCTLNTLIQAAWGMLLYKYSGESDVVFGMTVAGRPPEVDEIESIVGLFINTVPMRMDIQAVSSVASVLAAIQQQQVKIMEHEQTPLADIQAWSPLANSEALFDSIVVVENYPMGDVLMKQEGPLAIRSVRFDEITNYPITLIAMPGEQLSFKLVFDPDKVAANAAETMLSHFVCLLESIAAQPDRAVSQLAYLPQDEVAALLAMSRGVEAEYPSLPLPALVAQQASLLPSAVALKCADQSLTYLQLQQKSDQLAHWLVEQGLGKGDLVGLCMERSVDMVISMLAIMKAGCAYVPLDPDYPAERLGFILEDCEARLVLTQQQLLARLQGLALREVTWCAVDEAWDRIGQYSYLPVDVSVAMDDAAYLIYTSGSTGRPKGVINHHRGLCNRLHWMQEQFQLGVNDKLLQKTTFCFDVSVWELFSPLIAGATLVMAKPGGHLDPDYLVELIRHEQITLMHFVPSMLEVFLQAEGVETCTSLQRVVCSGEALSYSLKQRFHARLGASLFNFYGPTEAAIEVSRWHCGDDAGREIVPIGYPVPNTQLYVLNKDRELLPAGMTGELYIAGDQVATGYHKLPELSQKVFVADPYASKAGAVMYKTGDLVRYLPNRAIEYLGRADFQVKLRGQRIELGEIETAITRACGATSLVTVIQSERGDQKLLAYLVKDNGPVDEAELKQKLTESLPGYMVPSLWVQLECWPLNANGKVDRKALPIPDLALAGNDNYVAPRDEREDVLAQLWRELLQTRRVGIHDNFFELGGDSILSIQFVSRAKQAGYLFTAKQLFEQPTIAQLAQIASTDESGGVAKAEQAAVVGRVPMLPMAHWWLSAQPAQITHFNQAMLLSAPAGMDVGALKVAINALVVHHDALRTALEHEGGRWQTHILQPEMEVPVHCYDLAGDEAGWAEQIEHVAGRHQAQTDPSAGQNIQLLWFDAGVGGACRLALIVHHLVVDGISWRVLIEDLNTAYQQAVSGKPIALPEKTHSVADWAEELAERAQSQGVENQRDYWLAAAQAQGEVVAHDVTFAPEDNVEASADAWVDAISPEVSAAIVGPANKAYRTQVNDLLLTALSLAVAGASGRVRVDLEGHGREGSCLDVSRTVGWFTSLYPVALELPQTGLKAQIQAVKEQLRAIPDGGLGYGLLRYLQQDDALDSQSQIAFNYLGRLDGSEDADTPFQLEYGSAGPNRAAAHHRRHEIVIDAWLVEGQLHVRWSYSRCLHAQATIAELANRFRTALTDIARHCGNSLKLGYTPSDFPTVELNQQQLDKLAGSDGHIDDIYALTPTQQGMLFHSLYQQGSGVYVNQFRCRFGDGFELDAFQEAWGRLIGRHEVLRTGYVWQELAAPVAVVQSRPDIRWTELDWRHMPTAEQEQALEAWLNADREQGFDLTQAPLMRLSLIRMADDVVQFVWSHHHILMDGWSMAQLFKELFTDYAYASEFLQVPTFRYHAYRGHIEWLSDQDPQAANAYWREQLGTFAEPTPLPRDTARGAATAPNNERHQCLSASQTRQLEQFARQHHITLNSLVQGAWALLLHRYSGCRDIVFGSTVSGRTAELTGVEEMVGLFINTLPVRFDIDPDQPLLEWLQEIQLAQAGMRQFEYSSLAEIKGLTNVPLDLPLFESIVVFENYPVDEILKQHDDGFDISQISFHEVTNYALTLIVNPGEGLHFKLLYNDSRFEHGTISSLLEYLVELLSKMVDNPHQPLSRQQVLPAAQQQLVVVEPNQTDSEYAAGNVVDALRYWAEHWPSAEAVTFDGRMLSYAELDRQTNKLAHWLREQGVGKETFVGICAERSLEMVIAIWATIKAGGAYVPFDPDYPAERLAYMLEDAAVSVLLTQSALVSRLADDLAMQLCCLDQMDSQLAAYTDSALEAEFDADQAAYMIYTSGSTGRPKGVVNTHGALWNRLQWQTQLLGLDRSDVFVQKTTFCFDVSVWEFFNPLIIGASLEVARPGGHLDNNYLRQLIQSKGVSVIHFVPSMLQLFIDSTSVEQCRSLANVICSGEALPRDLAERVAAKLPMAELVNLYGPTEAAIDVSIWKCSEPSPGKGVPIGRAVPNTKLYILDEHLVPVPFGAKGELYIGGCQLARGYWNRPELNEERFVPDPFSDKDGQRLYRTGDQVCYSASGVIEYIGRLDFQVKLRGQRIELGEIEAAISQHCSGQAAVVLHEDAGGQRLVAFVAGTDRSGLDEPALRSALAASLPAYMVPGQFVTLADMPLTPNGKLDRKALRVPAFSPQVTDAVLPKTQEEACIASIWQEVLGGDVIGRSTNFFEAGGHSLSLIKVQSLIAERLGRDIALVTLFEYPTISALVGYMFDEQQTAQAEQDKVRETQHNERRKIGTNRLMRRRSLSAGTSNDKEFSKNVK
ncbi:amino acid adenylation domain-containing protein [Photobacterium satsumensis]|uniref:amino acid adenylation domain-containing protein n=1 Tax=Photobacterium satsumensis TaxID=2910239 RepID=UPI003D0EDFB2